MKETTPSRLALCTKLVGGKLAQSVLLSSIAHWHPYAKITLPNAEGTWIANPRSWWTREAQLGTDQTDRAMAGLCDAGLVEKRQFWFAGKNILHVRPLATVSNFLGSAVCWDAADEFVHNWRAAKQFGIPEHWSLWERPNLESCKLAELSSANQQSSNIISNELKIEHTNKHAHSATPPCAVKPGSSQNKSKIPGGMKPITSLIRYWLNINNIGSAAGLDAKTACALVEFYKGLRLLNSQGKYVDLRPYAKDILWFKWEKEPHWKVSKKADLGPAWNAAKKTFPAHLVDHISESAMQWEVAGRPKRHLMQGWD